MKYSVDIYDTILTRCLGTPRALFYWIGEALQAKGVPMTPTRFSRIRRNAELQSRQHATGQEVSLDGIYDEMVGNGSLELHVAGQAKALELELERSYTVLMPKVERRLKAMRREVDQLIFISDMYLPSSFIQALLEEHGIWENGDRLYVSGEIGCNKGSGKLFKEVLKREGLAPHELTHFGNNPRSDIAAAEKLGIATHYWAEGNLSFWEEGWDSHLIETEGGSSVISGVSRMARLSLHENVRRVDQLTSSVVGLAAPILFEYVRWLLGRAEKLEVERLYFVARDSRLLLDIAKVVCGSRQNSPELCYIYGSREAWALPDSPTKLDRFFFNTLSFYEKHLTLNELFGCLRLSDAIANEFVDAWGYADDERNRPLTLGDYRKIQNAFRTDGTSRGKLQAIYGEKRSLLSDYLKQEKVYDGAKVGFVDLGWHGSSLAPILRLMGEQSNYPKPEVFYFGSKSQLLKDTGVVPQTYAFDIPNRLGLKMNDIPLSLLLEVFCYADHGRTIGYVRNGDFIKPVFGEQGKSKDALWRVEHVREGCRRYAEYWLHWEPVLGKFELDLRPYIYAQLKTFWESPDSHTARIWGDFEFDFDNFGRERKILARPLKFNDLWHTYLWGNVAAGESRGWQSASLHLTPPLLRKVFRFLIMLHHIYDPWAEACRRFFKFRSPL